MIDGKKKYIVFFCILSACIFEPRNVNSNEVWIQYEEKLKYLTSSVELDSYENGIYDFPQQFDYPFDEGYSFRKGNDSGDTLCVTIKYYTDRKLLDHYSAFIYTTDTIFGSTLEERIKNKDDSVYKIEADWYYINV